MNNQKQFTQIRTKKIGLLIYDARISKGKSIEETSQLTGIPTERLQSFENGSTSPSLPEIEILAYTFNIPLEHFWGSKSLNLGENNDLTHRYKQIVTLRQKVIGANIKKLRNEKDIQQEKLAEQIDIPVEVVNQYELGEIEIPIPHLELISRTLNVRIEDFFDEKGLIGEWRNKMLDYQKIENLPIQIREFISKPVNEPYIELAIRLSELDVNKLRTVAEGLLEITL